MKNNIEKLLKKYYGFDSFRKGQEQIIEKILNNGDVLAVMPTGSGKSLCYQIPALIFDGITLVISPLISLMKDQVNALNSIGIRAAYFNSSLSPKQLSAAIKNAKQGIYKIIYVAPERLMTDTFLDFAKFANISFIAIDEAHCISQWGHDFRPSYKKICDFADILTKRPVLGAFTATATEHVKEDIINQLKLKMPYCISTGFNRANLFFSVLRRVDKIDFILKYLKSNRDKSGIIYCTTRKNVEKICSSIKDENIDAAKYHAGLGLHERRQNQEDFIYDKKMVMVATNAFGMGINKSNVSFVIHFNMPMNMEQYYQEAGRAGRDGSPADCILLYSKSDVNLCKFLIDSDTDNGEKLIEEERENLRELEYEKLRHMIFYSTTNRCLRKYILSYFGEKIHGGCNGCSNCLKIETINNFSMPKTKRLNEYINEKLLVNLKDLRKKISGIQGVPAYIIFSDAVLMDLCIKRPGTIEEMSQIPGIGRQKLEKYGKKFLDVINSLEGN